MIQFCTAFYKELKQKDQETQYIANYYNYPIFERYFYFLQYFDDDGFGNDSKEDRKFAANCCKDWIPNILFNILWDLDDYFSHTVDESYVKQAIKDIFS